MTDETIFELNSGTAVAPTAASRFIQQQTGATTRATGTTYALMGGLEHATGSDAATAMDVGKLYIVDMSGWATSDRIYSLPTTAAVGERIGVYVSSGNASYELQLRTTAASNDTINGTDYDSADWSKLFITGECVIFRCITANTAWIVEYDGRIPCKVLARDANGQTFTPSTPAAIEAETVDYDNGNLYDNSGFDFTIRRDGKYLITSYVRFPSMEDNTGAYTYVALDPDGVDTVQQYSGRQTAGTASTQTLYTEGVFYLELSDGDIIDVEGFQYSSNNETTSTTLSNQSRVGLMEIL